MDLWVVPRRMGPLLRTFELYLHSDDDVTTFEPLTCMEEEVIPTVRRMIAERGLASVEIHFMGKPELTIRR